MNIFKTDGFLRHHEGAEAWTLGLIGLSQTAYLLIIFGYLWTSYILYRLYEKRRNEIPRSDVFRIFIYIPLLIGLSRWGDFLSFYWPAYRLFVVWDWVCAVSVILIGFRLHIAYDYLVELPTVEQQKQINKALQAEVKARTEAQQQLEAANSRLQLAAVKFENMLQTQMWLYDKRKALEQIDGILKLLGDNENVDSH
jgi:hypothetical protein